MPPTKRFSGPQVTALATLALGTAPLAGFADTLAAGVFLGIAALVVAVGTTATLRVHPPLPQPSQAPLCLLVMAGWLIMLDIAGRALAFDAWLGTGPLLPLVVANGVVFERAVAGTVAVPPARTVQRFGGALADGCVILMVLAALGTVREIASARGLPASPDVPGTSPSLATAPAAGFLLLALLAAGVKALSLRGNAPP